MGSTRLIKPFVYFHPAITYLPHLEPDPIPKTIGLNLVGSLNLRYWYLKYFTQHSDLGSRDLLLHGCDRDHDHVRDGDYAHDRGCAHNHVHDNLHVHDRADDYVA